MVMTRETHIQNLYLSMAEEFGWTDEFDRANGRCNIMREGSVVIWADTLFEARELAVWQAIARSSYAAYMQSFQGSFEKPARKWDEIDYFEQRAFMEMLRSAYAATHPVIDLEINAREQQQIAHAQVYAEDFSDAGDPGHGHFMLIAKLAKAFGL